MLRKIWDLGAVKKAKPDRRQYIVNVMNANCCGCRQCINICHRNVSELTDADETYRIVVKHPERCTGCGKCIATCKHNTLGLASRKAV